MSRRPEILFPLFGDLTKLPKVGPKMAANFAKAGVTKPKDLIFTLPHRVILREPVASIAGIPLPAIVTVEVEVGAHQPNNAKSRPYRVNVSDAQTDFQLVFFHARSDWLRRQLPTGQRRIISGKLEIFDTLAQMVHPDYIESPQNAAAIPAAEAVYPLAGGVTQKVMQTATEAALAMAPDVPEWLDASVLKKRNWPSWNTALNTAHAPQSNADMAFTSPARERLAYDEFLSHQLTLTLARAAYKRAKGLSTTGTGAQADKVLAALPFEPTGAQTRAIEEIKGDMAASIRMNRLLQGDVGAGKTLVALMALITAVEAGGQGVMMAPTGILAQQHLAGIAPLCEAAGVRVELLTGRDKGARRREKLAALAAGEIDILIGTHAVFQADVHFQNLRLAVIDEQHRFGVRQRMDLGQKGEAVDILVMTATPIPRSLSLAHYGDMDISIIDEKPTGRQEIETVLISDARIDEVVARLKKAIADGKQIYWVCPLVTESEVLEYTAVTDRHRALRKELGEDVVGMVHGQMPNEEKDAAMARFVAGETKLLVATTVIEVGVDVPNASIMVIEDAEKFGLAQLHQLRGRVGRGAEKSSCLLMYSHPLGETAQKRLEVMRNTNDGFVIAEEDLAQRGAGDVLGVAQSGLPRFQIGDIESQAELMKMARDDARMIVDKDPKLTSERGEALRILLYLMEREVSLSLKSVG